MNPYTQMQKQQYAAGTSNHLEHNANPDYDGVLLKCLDHTFEGAKALDFGCGKGRNVTNLLERLAWGWVDGVDISEGNIEYCKEEYLHQDSDWFCNNGTDLAELESGAYDFVMSTIVLQHIPVYSIRKKLLEEMYRVLVMDGILSFQVAYGDVEDNALPPSGYYDENMFAQGTNSQHDFRVSDVQDVIGDLEDIGFSDVRTTIRDSFSDSQHEKWLYVEATK